jgi:hypothetical protein
MTMTRLLGFLALLALVFGAAALAGAAIDPDRAGDGDAAHAGDAGAHEPAHDLRGLAVADDGLRLELTRTELRRGQREQLSFRIVDDGGAAVRDFDVEHERRMHLILVRRDLTGFQHLHPTLAADGTWSVPARLPDAGSYRVFADFTRDGEAHTLAGDLRVDGAADLRQLPDPAPVARSDGYEVRLDDAEPGRLRFDVTRDGRPVEVEQYLGASGHLVALREGDLAFLHVHPDDDGFEVEFPTAGRYRLFLQFKDEGRVHTAAFTYEAER